MLRFSHWVVPTGRAVRREGGNRQRIAQPGEHRGGDGFDEVRRGVRDHRRAHWAAGVDRLQRISVSAARVAPSACQLRSTISALLL